MIRNIGQADIGLRIADSRDWSKRVGDELTSPLETPGVKGAEAPRTFGDFLQDSIGKVNEMQQQADVAMQKLASGESRDLHETLLAVEKAEIAFKTMNQVRSKVIEAYKEIMRMQI